MDTEGKPFVTFVNRKYPWYTWRRHRNHFYHTEVDTKISTRILTWLLMKELYWSLRSDFAPATVRKIVFFRVSFFTQVDFLKIKKRRKIIDKEFLCFHGTILESHPVLIVTNLRVKSNRLYWRVHNGKLKVSCIIGSQRKTRQVHATLVFIIAFIAHKKWKLAKTPDDKKTEDVTTV